MPIIEVSNLEKNYKIQKKEQGLIGSVKRIFSKEYTTIEAVRKVNFEINEGDFIGLVGQNGAGKTTLLKLLSGILNPTTGSAKIMGYTPWDLKNDFKKNISIIMGQRSQLLWDLPAIETFVINKEIYEISDEDYEERLNYLVELLDVRDTLNVQVRKLSLGQRMKMEFIAALLHKPKVVFLDEPTIGLDLIAQRNIRKFLKEFNRKEKSTIILTSHYMKDIVELCDKVILIDKGTIVYNGRIDEIVDNRTQYKNVTFSFENNVDINDFGVFGETLASTDGKVTIKVLKEEVSGITQRILGLYDVKDISMEEENIEDIIYEVLKAN